MSGHQDLLWVQDGTAKMSKSAESDLSRINLLDDADSIANKVKRAKTDAFEGLELDNPERPESRNLLTIYQLMTGYSKVSFIGSHNYYLVDFWKKAYFLCARQHVGALVMTSMRSEVESNSVMCRCIDIERADACLHMGSLGS